MARRYNFNFRRASRDKGTRVQVSPDGSVEVLHECGWFPDISAELNEDGTQVILHGVQTPSLVQFSGGDVVWCPLEIAGADIDPYYGNKIWKIMYEQTLKLPDTWEFETEKARRMRVYEALKVLSKRRYGEYQVDLTGQPGTSHSTSCGENDVDCSEDINNIVVFGDIAEENEFATYQFVGRIRYSYEQTVILQHDDLDINGNIWYDGEYVRDYAWWDDENAFRPFANGRAVYGDSDGVIRYKDDDTEVPLFDGADIDHDVTDWHGETVQPEAGKKYAIFAYHDIEYPVDENGEFLYHKTNKMVLPYIMTAAKTLSGDYIRDVEPIPTGYNGIGEYWTVDLYGHTYTTELYQSEDGTKWWYNPYSEDKFIAAPSPTTVQRYNGRPYNPDTDAMYSVENDPAIHPEILKTAEQVLINSDFFDKDMKSLSLYDVQYNDTEYAPQNTLKAFIYSIYMFDMRHGDTVVIRRSKYFKEAIERMRGIYHTSTSTEFEQEWFDAINAANDMLAGFYAFNTNLKHVTRLEIDYQIDIGNALCFDKNIDTYELVDMDAIYANFGMFRQFPKDMVYYTIPKRLTEEQKRKVLLAFDTCPHSFPCSSTFTIDVGVLSPRQKLELYLKHKSIKEILPENEDDLHKEGEFWVKDGVIYATGTVRTHCPSPLVDSRFENLYDPLAVELKPGEPIDVSEIPNIISLIKSGEKNKVRTSKVFPKHKDSRDRIVYDQTEAWVVPFLNELAVQFDNEQMLANIVYPDDEHLTALEDSFGLSVLKYPFEHTSTPVDTYEDDGLPTHDAVSRAKVCVDNDMFPYSELKQQLPNENVSRVATIVYFMGKASATGSSWTRTIGEGEFLPAGAEVTVDGTDTTATGTFTGNSEDVADPFEEYYYVEYTPTTLADGMIEISYTAYDADGNDVTDQVKTASIDEYLIIDEEV